jgi:hypothetical protein
LSCKAISYKMPGERPTNGRSTSVDHTFTLQGAAVSTTVVYLDDRRPRAPAKPVPVASFLGDLSEKTRELAEDWLFQSVGPDAKRRMLAERGIEVAEAAMA